MVVMMPQSLFPTTRRVGFVKSGIGTYRARDYGIPAGQADTMLSFVVPALREKNWAVEFSALEEMLASKRESAPGPDRLPYCVYRSAGGVGAKFSCANCEAVLMEAAVPAGFCALCFIPNSGDTNAQGLLIRTPEQWWLVI